MIAIIILSFEAPLFAIDNCENIVLFNGLSVGQIIDPSGKINEDIELVNNQYLYKTRIASLMRSTPVESTIDFQKDSTGKVIKISGRVTSLLLESGKKQPFTESSRLPRSEFDPEPVSKTSIEFDYKSGDCRIKRIIRNQYVTFDSNLCYQIDEKMKTLNQTDIDKCQSVLKSLSQVYNDYDKSLYREKLTLIRKQENVYQEVFSFASQCRNLTSSSRVSDRNTLKTVIPSAGVR